MKLKKCICILIRVELKEIERNYERESSKEASFAKALS